MPKHGHTKETRRHTLPAAVKTTSSGGKRTTTMASKPRRQALHRVQQELHVLASRTQHELERGVGAAYAEIVRELDAVRAEKSGGVVEVGRRAAETLHRLSTLEQRQVDTQHTLGALLSTLVQVGTSTNNMVAGMERVVHETHQFERGWQKSVIEQRTAARAHVHGIIEYLASESREFRENVLKERARTKQVESWKKSLSAMLRQI